LSNPDAAPSRTIFDGGVAGDGFVAEAHALSTMAALAVSTERPY
jgi:hypothetical protein